MTDEQLTKGVALQGQIANIKRLIERLENPGFFLQLRENDALPNSLILTVGVGGNSEHELAQYASHFQKDVIFFYESKLADKLREYEAL